MATATQANGQTVYADREEREDMMGETRRLYILNMAGGMESVKVIRETPKRYYTEHHRFLYGRKFVKKDDQSWFPCKVMALQYYREILKKRILYMDDELRRLVTELREAGITVHLKKSLDGLMEG